MKKVTIIIILLITLFGCTEELKNENVLNILKQEFNNDCLGNILLKTNTDKDSFKNEIKVLREAESNGYLTIVPKTFRHVLGNYTVYEGFPTKEWELV